MKVKIRYSLILSIILTIIMLIPDLMTNSRYYYSINMESDIPIGFMVFDLKAANEDTFSINKAEEITAKYQLSNFDSQDNINQVDVKYYVKILNENNSEDLAINISVNGLEYETGKGYGEINLPYDGETKETKDIDLKIACPENYEGAAILNYKVKILAKGISNENINAEKTANLNINIVESNNIPEELQNGDNTTNVEPNRALQNVQPLNIESINKKILETNDTTNTVNNSVANNDVNTNSSNAQNTNQTKSDNSSITNTTVESSNHTTTNSVSNEIIIDKENTKTEDKNQTVSNNTSLTNTTVENNTSMTNTTTNNASAGNVSVENNTNQTNTKSSNNEVPTNQTVNDTANIVMP